MSIRMNTDTRSHPNADIRSHSKTDYQLHPKASIDSHPNTVSLTVGNADYRNLEVLLESLLV